MPSFIKYKLSSNNLTIFRNRILFNTNADSIELRMTMALDLFVMSLEKNIKRVETQASNKKKMWRIVVK